MRVLNLFGAELAVRASAAVPDVEILTVKDTDVPAGIQAEVLFSTWEPGPLHERLDDLGVRWMHIPATGVDPWPRALLEGRTVTCTRGVAAIPIAEYVLTAILAFEKHVPAIFLDRPPEHWYGRGLGELAGKTVAIVGLGGIGEAVAQRALGFDCQVRAVRRRPVQGAPPGVELARDLDDLLASADHLVLAAPATETTRHLLDDAAFSRMKPGAHIVNIARGSLIDQDALRRALDDGRVAMATLDTATPEPLPEGHWMYAHPGVRITPHLSWSSPRAHDRIMQMAVENLERYVGGEPLVGIVDPAEGY